MMRRPSLQVWLGTSATALGDFASAEGSWEQALATTQASGNRFGESGILWKRAEALAERGEHAAAWDDFAASAAILEEFGARPQLARVLRGWDGTLRAGGDAARGEATLQRALTLFEEMAIGPEAAAVRASLAAPRSEEPTVQPVQEASTTSS